MLRWSMSHSDPDPAAGFTLPIAVTGLISAVGGVQSRGAWNDIHIRAPFIKSSANKTVPVAILTDSCPATLSMGRADGGLVLGSLRSRCFYSLFVDYYVSS